MVAAGQDDYQATEMYHVNCLSLTLKPTVCWMCWMDPVPDMTYNVFGGTLNLALSVCVEWSRTDFSQMPTRPSWSGLAHGSSWPSCLLAVEFDVEASDLGIVVDSQHIHI